MSTPLKSGGSSEIREWFAFHYRTRIRNAWSNRCLLCAVRPFHGDPPPDSRLYRADATFHIEAPTHEAAQDQLEDWVAEHMPSNFVAGWTLSEDTDDYDEVAMAEEGMAAGWEALQIAENNLTNYTQYPCPSCGSLELLQHKPGCGEDK